LANGTIDRLLKLLKLDELVTHLSARQIRGVKALVTESKQIFSENENDIYLHNGANNRTTHQFANTF
jgi:hypothetical protein